MGDIFQIIRELVRITTGRYPPDDEEPAVTLRLLQDTPTIPDEITALWRGRS